LLREASATAAGRYAHGGITAVFDGMVGPWFLPTFLQYSAMPSIHYVILLPSIEVCVDRVLTRERHGFRDVGVTRQMHASFAAADIGEEHVVEDVAGEPTTVAAEVLQRLADGLLLYP
jgi:hypothetical protein